MLRTLVIPEERWAEFFELINRLGRDRPIRIEVFGRALGDQKLARRQPFLGLERDAKGSERGSVTLTVGSEAVEHTHRIYRALRVSAAQDHGGVIEWVAIAEQGELGEATTLLHFEELPALEAEFFDAAP